MISLNGVLVSTPLLSGAYAPRTDSWLLAPIAVLLLGCTVAITFAVLAARPEQRGASDDGDDRQEVLIFQHFARMPRASFVLAMADVLREIDRVYTSMAVQIHELGSWAYRRTASSGCCRSPTPPSSSASSRPWRWG